LVKRFDIPVFVQKLHCRSPSCAVAESATDDQCAPPRKLWPSPPMASVRWRTWSGSGARASDYSCHNGAGLQRRNGHEPVGAGAHAGARFLAPMVVLSIWNSRARGVCCVRLSQRID
jgi:hypothetical protein